VLQPGPDWWIKISDFGISKRAEEGSTAFRTLIGTRGYLAPELFFWFPPGSQGPPATGDSSYTSAVDIWALGETVFRMITNRPAFGEPRDLYNYVVAGGPFPGNPLRQQNVEPSCYEFVESTMARSAVDRPTASNASNHAWVSNRLLRGNTFDNDEKFVGSIPPSLASEAKYVKAMTCSPTGCSNRRPVLPSHLLGRARQAPPIGVLSARVIEILCSPVEQCPQTYQDGHLLRYPTTGQALRHRI
jgi:serine/threonine protein kinase